jgi:hypothetical protein
MESEMDEQTQGLTGKMDIETDGWKDGQMDKQIERWTE